jgi:hypothetical protein
MIIIGGAAPAAAVGAGLHAPSSKLSVAAIFDFRTRGS